MKRDEAIKRFIQYSTVAYKSVNKIEKWDESKNILENALACGLSSQNVAAVYARRFDLKYKRRKYCNWLRKNTYVLKRGLIKELRHKKHWTLKQIADVLKMSRQGVEQSLSYWRSKNA